MTGKRKQVQINPSFLRVQSLTPPLVCLCLLGASPPVPCVSPPGPCAAPMSRARALVFPCAPWTTVNGKPSAAATWGELKRVRARQKSDWWRGVRRTDRQNLASAPKRRQVGAPSASRKAQPTATGRLPISLEMKQKSSPRLASVHNREFQTLQRLGNTISQPRVGNVVVSLSRLAWQCQPTGRPSGPPGTPCRLCLRLSAGGDTTRHAALG